MAVFLPLQIFHPLFENTHTKRIAGVKHHSFLQDSPPLNLSQKLCLPPPCFCYPPLKFQNLTPPFFFVVPPLIYNIQVFLHPKFST